MNISFPKTIFPTLWRMLLAGLGSAAGSSLFLLPLPVALKSILAIAFIGYLGFLVVRLLPSRLPWERSGGGAVALGFLVGWLAVSAYVLGLQAFLPLAAYVSEPNVHTAAAGLAVIFSIASFGLKAPVFQPLKRISFVPANLLKLAGYLVVIAGLTIPYLANPLAQDNDGFLFQVIRYAEGALMQASDLRPVFGGTVAFFANLSGLSPLHFYPLLAPILFFFGFVAFGDYVRDRFKNDFTLFLSLAVVAAPVIVTELYITRPQVILLAFILPLLALAQAALRHRSGFLVLSGLVSSIVLLTVHELSIVFVLLFTGLGTVILARKVWKTKELRLAQVGWGLIFIAPYLLLIPLTSFFNQAVGMSKHALTSTTSAQWDWWFIDSYVSIDGTNLGWPGIQSLHYYLYNGLLLYAALAVLWLASRKRSNGLWRENLPALLFVAFFFFFAEIAPRFGFTFLLNRTWPYIALGVLALTPTLISAARLRVRTAVAMFGAVGLLGLAGSAAVAKDNVASFFPEEKSAMRYLKSETPTNSLVLSHQNNRTLAQIHGGRAFALLDVAPDVSLETQAEEVLASLQKEAAAVQTTSTTLTKVVNEVSGLHIFVTTTTTSSQKADGQYNPDSVYYLFSKRKATGRNAERLQQYSETLANQAERPAFLDSYEPVYEDAAVIIVQIR